ncbi:hypothetical protein F4818DRAFT_435954 [Hypoxylon cercidicola]|nr:hypothetical protein F4818DRAFT_435954 [Hypoxylon cercidicola]
MSTGSQAVLLCPSARKQTQQRDGAPPPLAWSPLSYHDGRPTPLMESLLAAFFARLDPQNTGTVTPETLSAFLDVHGFAPEHNISVRNPGRPQLPYSGTPLLTQRGFVGMMAVEHAGDPERGWRGINAALRYYGV